MDKKFKKIDISLETENILQQCLLNGDKDSLILGYTLGLLSSESNLSIVSTKILDIFSQICYRLEDYDRAFDIISNILKKDVWSEGECDRLRETMARSTEHILNRFLDYDPERVGYLFTHLTKKRLSSCKTNNKITVTMTMCKRYHLFRKTVISFINCCEDAHLIDEWIVVDDNSSETDKNTAIREFPFIKFIWKGPEEKGHARSMNIIQKCVSTPYIFHIEDDWLFYRKEKYLSICLDILDSNSSYGQCLLNRSYGERDICYNIACHSPMTFSKNNNRYYEHVYYTGKELEEFNKKFPSKNCTYWPHYSLRVGMTRKDVFDKIGVFNESTGHFEMEYAFRYVEKGYKTVFMDNMYCYHTGRCTFERGSDLKNAYDLNNENQFGIVEKNPEKTPEKIGETNNPIKKLTLTEEEEKIPLYNEKYNTPVSSTPVSSTPVSSTPVSSAPVSSAPVSSESEEKYRAKTYVVNMEKRPDRLKQFVIDNHEKLQSLQYTFFKAVDGQNINPLPKTLKLFESGDYCYRKGIVGCASSHIKIWHELIISELDIMIVLEDDTILAPNFVEKLVSSLKKLPSGKWDILFLGHFLYPHLRKEGDKEDKTPEVEQWTRNKCIENSMGGTIGYVIHKRGAMKMFTHIQENGIYNAIDWVMFKNADKTDIFYCYPHIVFSECATNTIKPDSDIQYDKSSLCESENKRLSLELDYWKKRGVFPIIASDDKLPSRDKLLSHVYFIKTNKYLEIINKLQYYPLEFYTIKGKYIVSIPHTKIDKDVTEEVTLDGSYMNVNNPI